MFSKAEFLWNKGYAKDGTAMTFLSLVFIKIEGFDD